MKASNTEVSKYRLVDVLPSTIEGRERYEEHDLQVIDRGRRSSIGLLERSEGLDRVNSAVLALLIETAIAYGFSVKLQSEGEEGVARADHIAMRECAELVLTYYSGLSFEQIKHAFRIAHKTGADLEAYGKRFNAGYLKRVLDAYVRYVEEVLPALERQERIVRVRAAAAAKAEREAAKKAEREAAAARMWPMTVSRKVLEAYVRFMDGALRLSEVSGQWIEVIRDVGLLEGLFDEEDRGLMWQEAEKMVLAELNTEVASGKGVRQVGALAMREALLTGTRNGDVRAMVINAYCKVGLREFFKAYALDWDVRDMANQLFVGLKRMGLATLEEYKAVVDVDAILARYATEREAEIRRKAEVREAQAHQRQVRAMEAEILRELSGKKHSV